MSRQTTLTLVLGLAVVSLGGFTAACSGSGQETTLIRSFFQAARYDDRAALGNISMVSFDSAEEGVVSGVGVQSVSEEEVRPLRLRTLVAELEEARAAEQTFAGEKQVFQGENFEAITRVLEAERESEDVASSDQEVQAAWTVWRDETMDHARTVSDAQSVLNAESLLAEISANDPNNPLDVQEFDGDLISKDVVITASVELDDVSEDRTMTITLQRVILEDGETPIEGRWIVTDIR